MVPSSPKRSRSIRVLIVDDSSVVRKLLSDALSGEPDIEVVGTAPDPFVARDKILELKPDVLTLDIEMPRMNGLVFLKKVMHYKPMPVIIISSLGVAGCAATVEALRLGAVDVLCKPHGPYSVGDLASQLAGKVRMAADARLRPTKAAPAAVATDAATPVIPAVRKRHLVAIGSSTGGTTALENLMRQLGGSCPPIVIAQHIPAGFSGAFARRLNEEFPFEVKEAEDGDEVRENRVLIAPGNFHMLLQKRGMGYQVAVKEGPLVCYQRPSVDVLFGSIAQIAANDTVAVILTGMGSDGAKGMKRIHDAGGWTIAQDEASCVVYGMPREAVALGAVDESVSLDHMAATIGRAMAREPRAGIALAR